MPAVASSQRKLCVTIFIVQTASERCWCTFDGRARDILSRWKRMTTHSQRVERAMSHYHTTHKKALYFELLSHLCVCGRMSDGDGPFYFYNFSWTCSIKHIFSLYSVYIIRSRLTQDMHEHSQHIWPFLLKFDSKHKICLR